MERLNIIEHAKERIKKRGTSIGEVEKVLEAGKEVKTDYEGRRAKEMVFSYNRKWQKKFYPEKKVKVIYREEGEVITVITVYVYFGKWGEQ